MTEQENYANLVLGLLNAARELLSVGQQHWTNTELRLAMDDSQQDIARAKRGLTNALSHSLLQRHPQSPQTQQARTLSSDLAEDRG